MSLTKKKSKKLLPSGSSMSCSFCGKTQKEFKKLVVGPGVNICDDCVRLCAVELDIKVVDQTLEPFRRRLPAERQGLNHKFDLGGCKGYLTVGLFPDGTVGEIFLKMAKQGSTVGGFADAWATAFSMALQYGVPLEKLCTKFTACAFEPCGHTGRDDVPYAASVIDYVSRWLMAKYGPKNGGGM